MRSIDFAHVARSMSGGGVGGRFGPSAIATPPTSPVKTLPSRDRHCGGSRGRESRGPGSARCRPGCRGVGRHLQLVRWDRLERAPERVHLVLVDPFRGRGLPDRPCGAPRGCAPDVRAGAREAPRRARVVEVDVRHEHVPHVLGLRAVLARARRRDGSHVDSGPSRRSARWPPDSTR